jgi:hypothetical protein
MICVPGCVCACSLSLQNFFPGLIMEVTIGAQPCAGVVITDNATLGELSCVAPPGPGFGAVQLRVTVEGSGTGAIRFAYDAPVVTRVLGSPCDAAAVCSIQVRPALRLCAVCPHCSSMVACSAYSLSHALPLARELAAPQKCVVCYRVCSRHLPLSDFGCQSRLKKLPGRP